MLPVQQSKHPHDQEAGLQYRWHVLLLHVSTKTVYEGTSIHETALRPHPEGGFLFRPSSGGHALSQPCHVGVNSILPEADAPSGNPYFGGKVEVSGKEALRHPDRYPA